MPVKPFTRNPANGFNMAGVKKIYLFNPALEKAYLALLAASLFLTAVLGPTLGWHNEIHQTFWIKFLVGYVLLNLTHTVFSILLLLFVPEIKKWFLIKIKNVRWLIQFSVITVLIIACGYFVYLDRSIKAIFHPTYSFFILGLMLMQAIHNLTQTKGISLLYNKLLLPLLLPDESARHHRAERRERILFNSFIWFQIANFLFLYFRLIRFPERMWLFYAGTIPLALLIIANSFTFPQVEKTYKRFFSLGTLFLSVAFYSPLVLLIQRSLHGVEYTFLTYGMLKKSKINLITPALVVAVSLFALMLTIRLVGSYENVIVPPSWQSFIIFLTVVNFFLDFFHYYIDSQFFRFSDSTTREYVQPLMPSYTDHQSKP